MHDINFEEMKFNEVIKHVKLLDNSDSDSTPLKIAILRNITVDTVVPYLKLLCYGENIKADVYMGEYDNVMQEVINPGSVMYIHSPDIIVVCLKKETLCADLTDHFNELSQEVIDAEVKRVLDLFDSVISAIRRHSEAVILLHNFEVPVFPSFGILDLQENNKQVNTFRRINTELIDLSQKYESVYMVDMDLLQSVIGYSHFFDHRYWHIGKAPYTRVASKALAKEYIKFIRAIKGKNKKCLVLDCDNTLWGGIVGEDGMENIQIGRTYPGSAFLEFQNAILNLYHRGIILGICSKNNEKDVLDVLENHPDMVLRKEHFVLFKINWDDKVSNLKEITKELNIGLDSLVFIDDNEFEINMVKQLLPQVKAILLPKDPSQYSDLLKSSGLFDSLNFSNEDRTRSKMYKANISRKHAASMMNHSSLEDYFKYLEMKVTISSADSFAIPRISQLTQRTNQFNLTTKRHSESEINEFVDSDKADVRYLKLKDRFGDSGIVGVAILKYEGEDCLIDTFLLSCRVIGRGVEGVLINDCEKTARKKGCKRMIGFYIPTQKNGQVELFYKKQGFILKGEKDGGIQHFFSLENTLSRPDYFKLIVSD